MVTVTVTVSDPDEVAAPAAPSAISISQAWSWVTSQAPRTVTVVALVCASACPPSRHTTPGAGTVASSAVSLSSAPIRFAWVTFTPMLGSSANPAGAEPWRDGASAALAAPVARPEATPTIAIVAVTLSAPASEAVASTASARANRGIETRIGRSASSSSSGYGDSMTPASESAMITSAMIDAPAMIPDDVDTV
jgi:hypothetical protein